MSGEEVLLFHDVSEDDQDSDEGDTPCPCELEAQRRESSLASALARMDRMIAQSQQGGYEMACKMVYSPYRGGMIRKCTPRSRKKSSFGTLPPLGQATSLKANFDSIKGVVTVGAIAAAGAVINERIFNLIASKIQLTGVKKSVAEMATGIALGIVVGKVLKKPKLGANLAIGPIVFSALKIFGELMNTGPLSGLGLQTIEPYRYQNPYMAALPPGGGLGVAQVGAHVPQWMMDPHVDPNYAGSTIAY